MTAAEELGGHALRGGDLDQAFAERPDDPPPAEVGPQGDGDGARDLDPQRHGGEVAPLAGADEGEGDDAHRLLRVVRAVGERDEGGGADLAPAEPGFLEALGDACGDLVDEPRADGRHHHRDDGGEERGHDHLAHDPVEFAAVADPVDTGEAQPGDRRADEPAEEGVGGRRRQAEQPGQEVPDDAAAEAGQDDEQQRIAAIGEQGRARRPALVLDLDDCVGHGERDLDGEESADEVEHGAEEDGGFRAEGARGDRGRHGVSGVVETVGEVEGQGCRDDEAEDDGCGGHAYIVRMPLPELSGLGSPMSKSSATVHAPYAGPFSQPRSNNTAPRTLSARGAAAGERGMPRGSRQWEPHGIPRAVVRWCWVKPVVSG